MNNILVTPRLLMNETYYEIREALNIHWYPILKSAGLLLIFPTRSNIYDYLDAKY